MEFKEFPNPESADYDVKSSLENNQVVPKKPIMNSYTRKLMELVGFLEDGEFEEYGLTEDEYMNPTANTILKVEQYLETKTNHIR